MLRYYAVYATCGVLFSLLLTGCATPFDEIESRVDREFSEITHSRWIAESSQGEVNVDQPAHHTFGDINENSSLGDCLRQAAKNSPQLQAAFFRWQAALEKVPQVTSMPDPNLSYGYYLNEIETRIGPQQHRMKFSQMFPWFGKLDLKGDVVAEMANVEYEKLLAAELDLVQRVKEAYYELYYLRGAVETTKENLQLLEQFEQIARIRYRVAAAKHPDVIRMQVEIGKLEERVAELEDRRNPLSARLNAALNRPADSKAPWPGTIPDPVKQLDEDKLKTQLRNANPALAILDRQIEQHRAASQLAHKSFYPDIMLSLDYVVTGEAMNSSIPESGDDAVIAGIGINVPIWRAKYEAGVREAVKRRLSTAAQKADMENRLLAMLEQSLFNHRDALRKIELYHNTLIPKSNESLEAAVRAYETGSVMFTDLLDAQRVLLELQLAEVRANANAAIAISKIEVLVGEGVSSNKKTNSASEDSQ